MTKEKFEAAKNLEKKIEHISKVIEFIKEHRCLTKSHPNTSNIFLTNEADDYTDLTNFEVDFIIAALEGELCLLKQEFEML